MGEGEKKKTHRITSPSMTRASEKALTLIPMYTSSLLIQNVHIIIVANHLTNLTILSLFFNDYLFTLTLSLSFSLEKSE